MNSWYVFAIYYLVILVFSITLIITLVMQIVSFKKKKYSKKIIISFITSILLLVFSILFTCSHSTYYKYNDWWILNSNITKVENRYGDFDLGNYVCGERGKVGYYIYTDNGPIMPDHLKHYYYIEYDEYGIVYNVYDGCQPGG